MLKEDENLMLGWEISLLELIVQTDSLIEDLFLLASIVLKPS